MSAGGQLLPLRALCGGPSSMRQLSIADALYADAPLSTTMARLMTIRRLELAFKPRL
jgi:hypothetical protein